MSSATLKLNTQK